MPNLNKVLLMGHLTREPQLSYTPNQTPVVDFGIAVNYKYSGKEDAKKEVCFVDCRCFGKRAEAINQYLTKGDPIFIEGRLTFDQWEAQDGTKRYKHRVTINDFQFIGTTKESKVNDASPPTDEGDMIPF
jgi:single-strand DNA-binding protein